MIDNSFKEKCSNQDKIKEQFIVLIFNLYIFFIYID